MSRGRPPLPTNVKRLKGTLRKDRTPHNEPAPALGAPPCPEWLGDLAKEEWRRVVPELISLGLLTKIDRAALAGYCHAWAEWQTLDADVQENGIYMETGNGYQQVRPAVTARDKAIERCLKFAREFGFTPAARTRISVPKKSEEDDNPFAALG